MAKKKQETEIHIDNSRMFECTVENVLHNSMIPFSEHVIMERALPRLEDGLKPVQRRILFAMQQLGITPDKSYVKSARVVGECLGKYHPHGDSSVYDALVRLAQPFNVRMPLIEGQGNYGSIDGDGAAAMRYTEAKLAPLSMELLRDLDKDTIPMVLNFDDTLEEPDILPGRYPNLLVNGATGIAVGMSTNIPTHNLGEMIDGVCAYIDDKKITLDQMMQYIPAPDFPTGATIIETEGIRESYATGKGRVIMRAKTNIEKDGDRESIIITEVPFQVNKAALLQDINALRETKKDLYGGIQDIVDESNRNGIRCVLKIKKDASATRILAGLLKSTKLECAFSVNMIAIADGKPEQLTLMSYIEKYVEFQRQIVYRRCQFELTAASNRAHILAGLLIAIKDIRRVVDIVLSSKTYEEEKERIRAEFELTEKQTIAVLDIPLKRLNRLDVTKIQDEYDELMRRIAELESIIASSKKQLAIVKKELLEIKKKYDTPRCTEIIKMGSNTIVAQEIIEAPKITGYLVLSHQGTLRFLTEKAYTVASKNIVNCAANELAKTVLKVDSEELVLAITKNGSAVVFTPNMIQDDKWKSRGTSVGKLGKVDSDDNIVEIFTSKSIKNKELYFATQNGMIKKTAAEEYPMDKKTTYPAMNLKDEDKILAVQIVDANCENILFITELGNVLNAFADVPAQSRKSSGVKGIKLAEKDTVKYVSQNNCEGEIVTVLISGFSKRVILASIDPKNRYGKGVTLCDVTKPKQIAYVGIVKEPYDLAVYFADGDMAAINTEDISIENRTAKGKNILKMISKSKFESIIYNVYSHNLIK